MGQKNWVAFWGRNPEEDAEVGRRLVVQIWEAEGAQQTPERVIQAPNRDQRETQQDTQSAHWDLSQKAL